MPFTVLQCVNKDIIIILYNYICCLVNAEIKYFSLSYRGIPLHGIHC